MTAEERQAVLDEEHLRLLELFHYISGGITVVGALLAGMWALLVGTMFALVPMTPPSNMSEEAFRQFRTMPTVMAVFFGAMAVLAVVYGVAQIAAGRCIRRCRARLFTLIAALPRVIFVPYGTLLSIFTLMVLERASVQRLYATGTSQPPSTPSTR